MTYPELIDKTRDAVRERHDLAQANQYMTQADRNQLWDTYELLTEIHWNETHGEDPADVQRVRY